MRAFVALTLPREAAAGLARLASLAGAGRPVPEDNLHLTLAFLDAQPPDVLAALDAELSVIPRAPLVLRPGPVDVFGAGRGAAVAVTVAADPALVALAARVGRACRAAGIVLSQGRFRPHVTILRMGAGTDPGRLSRLLAAPPPPPFAAVSLALFRSDLHRDGARHGLLSDYPLPQPMGEGP